MGFFSNLKKNLTTPLGVPFEFGTPKPEMTRCKACGAEISALADACPKCGHPSAAKQIQGVGAILLVIGLAIIFYYVFIK